MAITREQAQAIINVVAADTNCVKIINSGNPLVRWQLFGIPTPGLHGQLRNMSNIMGDIKDAIQTLNIIPGQSVEFSTQTENEMCIGIQNAVVTAFLNSKSKLPFVNKVGNHRNKASEGHYQPIFTLSDGSQYIFDWWMTLRVYNPIIWHPKDWEQWPDPHIYHLGVPFWFFRGFN